MTTRRFEELVESYVAPLRGVFLGRAKVAVDLGEDGRHLVPAPVAAHLYALFQLASSLETRLDPRGATFSEAKALEPVEIRPRRVKLKRGG